MAFVKFEENRFRIGGEIAENHAILVNLTASIVPDFSANSSSILMQIYRSKFYSETMTTQNIVRVV